MRTASVDAAGGRLASRQAELAATVTETATGQARVSAALARVGHELMRSLAKPALFERLCELTANALAADASSTLLHDARSRSFLPVARSGESRRFAYLADPAHPIAIDVSRRLRTETVLEIPIQFEDDPDHRPPSRWLCIALRRESKLAGILVVGRLSGEAYSADDRAIAEGIGQLASLSLENARLMSEIERVNHIKSDFVATMSHELRTPLNIILGYLSLLLEGDFGALSEAQTSALGHVDRSARALLELVQDTLDLSRLERESLPVVRKEIALGDLFADVERDALRMPRAPEVALDWQLADGLPTLQSDAGKLKIVLRSLLSNALKFTTRGKVSVCARPCADGVELTVADTGVGVPRSEFSRIFEPFTQLGRASTRTHGGVGMGLYIARRLTELLGGTIAVSSRVGVGSTFQVWIPAVAPIAPCDPASLVSPRG